MLGLGALLARKHSALQVSSVVLFLALRSKRKAQTPQHRTQTDLLRQMAGTTGPACCCLQAKSTVGLNTPHITPQRRHDLMKATDSYRVPLLCLAFLPWLLRQQLLGFPCLWLCAFPASAFVRPGCSHHTIPTATSITLPVLVASKRLRARGANVLHYASYFNFNTTLSMMFAGGLCLSRSIVMRFGDSGAPCCPSLLTQAFD